MPSEPLTADVMKALMTPAQFSEWERQQEARRAFWRTLKGPALRPDGANADEWHMFLSENKDALGYLAVQIAEAIDDAERRGYLLGRQRADLYAKSL